MFDKLALIVDCFQGIYAIVEKNKQFSFKIYKNIYYDFFKFVLLITIDYPIIQYFLSIIYLNYKFNV